MHATKQHILMVDELAWYDIKKECIKLKNYIYLSPAKIDPLYQQIQNISGTEHTAEGNLSAGVASCAGKIVTKEIIGIEAKLETVLKKIKPNDICEEHSEYIHASMSMAWGESRFGNPSTFWIGTLDSPEGTPYHKLIVLLIGSANNIIGNSLNSGTFISTSYIDAFFANFEQRLNLDAPNQLDKADGDLAIIEHIKHNSQFRPLFHEHEVCQYTDELLQNYCGNFSKYEFVAHTLLACCNLDEHNRITKYLIATPLYVSQSARFFDRVLTMPDGTRKYILTSDEFKEHRKQKFISLSQLLINADMKDEERRFTELTKNKYKRMGGSEIFKSDVQTSIFIDSLIPIIHDYFYILDSTKD